MEFFNYISDNALILIPVLYILGKNDSADNYVEVGREIWKHFIEEENPEVNELKEQFILPDKLKLNIISRW